MHVRPCSQGEKALRTTEESVLEGTQGEEVSGRIGTGIRLAPASFRILCWSQVRP